MILYHASTMYHLLYCIVHKLTVHENEPCRLLLVESIATQKERRRLLGRLRGRGWFEQVNFIPEGKLKFGRGRGLNEHSSDKEIEAAVKKICRNFALWFREDLRSFDKIYAAADQWSFGISLLYNKVPYIYMEDAGGMLSQQERYLAITKGFSPTNYYISEYLGGAGRNDIVTKKLCDLACQQPGFADERAEDFSIHKALREKIPHHIDDILYFYRLEKIEVQDDERYGLFLTQYIKTMADWSLDSQECLTTLLVDYICPKHKLMLKAHPKDRWLNYRRMFPHATILPNGFPAELLPFILDKPFDVALTASSTSIGGVAPFSTHAYNFGTEIETKWQRLHLMAAAVHVLKTLGIKSAGVRCMNEEQMRHLLDVNGISNGNEALIDGGLEGYHDEVSLAPLTLLLQFDESEHMAVCDAQIEVKLLPREGSILLPAKFTIYATCDDAAMLEKLRSVDEKIKLKFSKAMLEIKGVPA